MILLVATVTAGSATAILCVTVGVVALIVRVLDAIDLDDEPAWWPEFEAQFAAHVESVVGH